ncbi:MAG: NAD(+) kinase [Pseudomonadota bacterium]
MTIFKTIGLIAKYGDERVKNTLEALITYLGSRQLSMLIDIASTPVLPDHGLTAADMATLGEECDLIIVIGGDGTMLQAARNLASYRVKMLGINLGRLGFLTDISPNEMTEQLELIMDGDFQEEKRSLLYSEVYRDGERLCQVEALNDVVIHKYHMAHMFAFETRIDGQLVNKQRADGLIVSTPTGSTAYALSGGGPIIHPSLDAILLVTVCPHTLTNRPVVVRGDSRIVLHLTEDQNIEAQLTCDGQLRQTLQPDDQVHIRKDNYITLVHPSDHEYYETLRTKLNWGNVW